MAAKKSIPPLGIMSVFPTHIGQRQYDAEGLNQKLISNIYRNKGEDSEGMYRSNAAGTWHSDTDLLSWIDEPDLGKMFQKSFCAYTQTYGVKPNAEIGLRLQAWAMVYKDGGYATVHTHPNCHMSAVYYLDNTSDDVDHGRKMVTGARACPGDIEFVDSRASGGYQFPGVNLLSAFRLTPTAGMMIVFPSWLQHFVHPIIGKKDRLCISCNATITSHNPPKES
jgi:hypothetical protein